MKLPIGHETQKKASKTTPGQLAALLNRLLYVGDYRTVVEEGWSVKEGLRVRRWVTEDLVYRGSDDLPEGMPNSSDRPSCFETEVLLRAIRDYLELKSFEEVIP